MRYPDNINKNRENIQGLRIKKQRIIDYNANNEDQFDDLIEIIEELQKYFGEYKNILRNLKIDNIKKDKEIDNLINELHNM